MNETVFILKEIRKVPPTPPKRGGSYNSRSELSTQILSRSDARCGVQVALRLC